MTDIEDAPKIELGGKAFPVPPLAAKQNRIIDPLILSLLPVFGTWQTDRTAALTNIKEKEYDALQEIAYQAIKRAQPEWTRDQFLELPVTLPELIAAFPIVAQQTGVFKRGEPGEASAAPSRPTGTESSPTSAT